MTMLATPSATHTIGGADRKRDENDLSCLKHCGVCPEDFPGDEGEFKAVFATLNEVDKHYDVIKPGAIGKQEVLLSDYNHAIWTDQSSPPIGSAWTSEEYIEGKLCGVLTGKINLGMPAGMAMYSSLRFSPHLFELSWGFFIKRYDFEDDPDYPVMIMNVYDTDIAEGSFVIRGAGNDTRLLELKRKVLNAYRTGDPNQGAAGRDSSEAHVRALAPTASGESEPSGPGEGGLVRAEKSEEVIQAQLWIATRALTGGI